MADSGKHGKHTEVVSSLNMFSLSAEKIRGNTCFIEQPIFMLLMTRSDTGDVIFERLDI